MSTAAQIRKRDGRIVPFDRERIVNAIFKAARAVGQEDARAVAEHLTDEVVALLSRDFFAQDRIPSVEEIQDLVEAALIENGYVRMAKAYILYRQQRAQLRETKKLFLDALSLMDDYLECSDWRVSENANMTYSLQGLNFHVASAISARYWLHKIYPSEVQEAHVEGDFHIHDLSILAPYCCGWDLEDLLLRGFGGVPAKTESKPPRHLRSALGQIVNFFYTLQGESAGAQAVSNFDTLLAPFVRYDGLDYRGVKQAVQEFVFNINVPTRVGFQSLAYDVPVVVRKNGRVLIERIGRLVEEEFGKNRDRVVHNVDGYGNPSPESLMVFPRDDYRVLGFDEKGGLTWLKMRGLVKHRVRSNGFKRVRTGAGEVRISPAHSLFRLNGGAPEPITPLGLESARPNQRLNSRNHALAVRKLDAHILGREERVDLVRLALGLPPSVRRNFFVKPSPNSLKALRGKLGWLYGSKKQMVYEQGRLDKSTFHTLMQRGIVPLALWALWTDDFDEELEIHIKPYPERSYPRYIEGEMLESFVELCAWFAAEGKAQGSNIVISQERGKEGGIRQALEKLGLPVREFETTGWSSTRHSRTATEVVNLEVSGLYAYLLPYIVGATSSEKQVPSFVFDLSPTLRRLFLETLICGDGTFEESRLSLCSKSDKLITGASLIAISLGYKVSLTRKDSRTAVHLLLIYPEPKREVGPSFGDLAAVPVYEIEDCEYENEWEYDLSVEAETENFVGGSGLLVFHNTPFTNLTMDLVPPGTLRDKPVIIGGEFKEETYGEFQREMDLINRAFAEVMLEGDAKGRVFTFPIPTYNITKDFDWENPAHDIIWQMTAKYGIPYFANFVNSDMSPEDARSMCCRLRLDNRELRKRGGGYFGANPLTGSIGVVTINMARLGYLAKDEEDFFRRLGRLMEIAKTSLEIKRKTLERFTERGLYPYAQYYLASIKRMAGAYWANHFSTIGLNGMNEACLNLLGVSIAHPDGKALALKTLNFMREKLRDFQAETGNLYNLEATPAEGASYRLAKEDKARFQDIITAGTDEAPYYTNCLSSDTEVLTKEGWRTHDQLKIGDEVLTYNLVTKMLEYQKIRNVYVYNGEWEMVNIQSKAQDQLVTLNHMVLFEPGARKGFEFLVPAAHLPRRNFMVRMGAPWCIQEDNQQYSDDLLRLTAWIVTEGHFEGDCDGIRIVQSRRSKYWEEIRGILDRLQVKYSILGTGEGKHKDSIFRISACDGKWIKRIVHKKALPQELLNSLSERQLDLLLLELAKGDGVIRNGYPIRIYAGSAELAGQYQEIAIKTNKRSVIGYGAGAYYVDIVNSRCKSWIMEPPKRVSYKGTVWCIEVPNHTFVARRNGKPFITGNSTHLPVSYTDDVFEALEHQDDLQVLYTGGTVFHAFLGEKIDDWRQARLLVRRIAENFRLPYYTLTPTFSICPIHGYVSGEHFYCPYPHTPDELKGVVHEDGKVPCEVYSRIVGYLRPIQNWNVGKRQEFAERKEYLVGASRP
jgi:anaerobic ribonucleoside-triphosphate reductase